MKHWHIHYVAAIKDGAYFKGCRPMVAAPNERIAYRAFELLIRSKYKNLDWYIINSIHEVTE